MRTFVVFLLPAMLALAACSKDPASPNTSNNQPVTYGSYVGTVVLHGVNSKPLLDQSGTRVTINGTSYDTTTDANGNFVLAHVASGTYNITFTKPGFDTVTVFGDRFSGIDTSRLLTQHLQMIPYDSLICDSMRFYFNYSRNVPTDTVAIAFLDGKILYHTYPHSPDSVYVASVRIVRQNIVGGSTDTVFNSLLSFWLEPEHTFDTYIDSTLLSKKKLCTGDKLTVYIRAAGVPLTNSPVIFSPYVTRKEVVVE